MHIAVSVNYLQSNESIFVCKHHYIKVEILNSNFDYKSFTTTAVNSSSLTLTTIKLALLPVGQYTIQLTRTKTLPLQESTDAGGEIFAKYKTLTKAVYLK